MKFIARHLFFRPRTFTSADLCPVRPTLTVLEDRLAPAMFVVPAANNADPAPLPPPSSIHGTIQVQSLRQAIIDANAFARADPSFGTDQIQLGSGTYSLTRTNGTGGQENAAQTGDLDITTTHALMIMGQGSSGPNATIIDGSALQDRLFQVLKAGTMVQFRDLVLQGGVAHDNGTAGTLPGSTDAWGGALLNQGGSVTLLNVIVQNNQAQGANGSNGGPGMQALGGGVYSNGGTLSLHNVTLSGNIAQGGAGGGGIGPSSGGDGGAGGAGGLARGGGLYAAGGLLNLQGFSLTSNKAQGGSGGAGHDGVPLSGTPVSGGNGGSGAAGQGGGAYLNGVTLVGQSMSFAMNTALGGTGGGGGNQSNFSYHYGINGAGGSGGAGQGGGLMLLNGTATLTNSTFGNDIAQGGNGNYAGSDYGGGPANGGQGGSAQGGGVYVAGATLHLPGATFSTNTAQGGNGGDAYAFNSRGGNGGGGQGAGLFAGGSIVDLSDATLSSGLAQGGSHAYGDGTPGVDGDGEGGAVVCAGATLTLLRSTLMNNTAQAVSTYPPVAMFAGAGYGGGLYVSGGNVTVTNSTVAANTVPSTPLDNGSGSTTPSTAEGGGLYAARGTIDLRNSTVADNTAGSAGGGVVCGSAATVKALSVLFGGNTAGSSAAPSDFTGNVTASASLFQTAPTGTITADPRSQRPNLLNVDPLLGTLGEHGGPTSTIYLQSGSPALGTGDNPLALTTDQRGFAPRTTAQGNTDIGAFQASLSNGQIGTPYSQQFPTTAPAGALRYAVTAGALPSGLSLSAGGLLSGTPTAGGVFSFSITITDPSNATDTLPCTLTVWNPQPIGWQPSRDVTISGNSLSVAVAGNWGRGAASAQTLTGDGSVVFTATEANTFRALGLTHNAPNHSYAGMDFCLELTAAGQVVVYEGGVYQGGIGHYGSGDQFRIAVEGGRVNYYQKAAGSTTWSLLRSVIAGITYPLRVDTSFCSAGATLSNVNLGRF
jgi:hypothetical protein